MKFSSEERRRRQEQFRNMTWEQKLEHIWQYEKIPILLTIFVLGILLSSIFRLVNEKEPVLYLTFLNVSMEQDMETTFTEDFLTHQGINQKQMTVSLTRGLYLSDQPSSENYQYAYASNMNLMASMQAKQIDVVIMNQEAYDFCSARGYLMDLTTLLPPDDLEGCLTSNEVILEDNGLEYSLKEAEEYIAVTQSVTNGLDISHLPVFQQSGFSGKVYLGILYNTPRPDQCRQYVQYLLQLMN